MKGKISKRIVSLLLVVLTIITFLPTVTLSSIAETSGTLTGLNDENIGLSFDGNAGATGNPWTASGTAVTGTVKKIGARNYKSTLTIKNKMSVKAILSFDYKITANGGIVKVDGKTVTTDGNFSKELAAGETVMVYIESKKKDGTTIELTNIKLLQDVTATTTFLPAENGSYTVNGENITASYSNTQSSANAYELVASPASGYNFDGWYNVTTGKYISTDVSASLNIESDCTIIAKFARENDSVFDVNGRTFGDLNAAIVCAQNTAHNVVAVIKDSTLTGNYTIPNAVTLLIPFDDAKTLYKEEPEYTTTAETPKAYRTLTMAPGSSLIVNGSISVGGKHFTSSAGECCKPTGAYGLIKMQKDSSITLNSGAALFAWGYIIGDGNITANSGSKVYEYFQIADWRGGTASFSMNKNPQKVFPISQYYIQNIEAALTLKSGAKEHAYISIESGGSVNSTIIQFIGANDALFSVEAGGQITKKYDPKTDRMSYAISGNASLNSINIEMTVKIVFDVKVNIDSADYNLPINSNMDIIVVSGTTTLKSNTALLPGVKISVAKDAELKVANGASLYIYDNDEWNTTYVYGTNKGFAPVPYSPSGKGNRTLSDVTIDVNGIFKAEGAVYTTKSGADICSSEGTGRYIQQSAPGTSTETNQCTQKDRNITYVAIPIAPAKLHNADGSYTETAGAGAGTTYYYSNGKWSTNEPCKHTETEIRNAKEASCTEKGYTGDLYCKKCGEKISSGKVIDAKGHTEVVDAAVAATCTETGLTEGKHCSVCNEVIVKQEVVPANGHNDVIKNAKEATDTEDGYTGDIYCSVCNKLLKSGEIIYHNGWRKTDGEYYYYQNQKPVTGIVRVAYPDNELLPGYGPDAEDAEVNVPGKEGNPDNYDYPDRESALFVFDENGVFQKDQCGVYDDNGVTRWINNGMVVWHAGLVKDGDDYRYFKRNGMVTNVETYVAKTNGLLKAAKYTFDSEGELMQLQGLHEDLNGNLCYYVDYVKSYAGLVEVDGNYYYIASDLKAVKNCTYYVTKTNELKDAGYYTFDADGKMVIKNGLVEENGDLYYYVDGAKTAAGLIEVDGNYYYIASNLKAVKNAKHYVFADKANNLVSAGWYWFNADGTMFLNGMREENGTKYYYKDGTKNYAGLVEIDGAYYYVKSDCSVVCGRSYYVTKTNGLVPRGTYTFDADGKMEIKNGIYREKLGDGNEYLFYYVNNERQINTGLVQLDDGSYIYVRSGANLAVGDYYVTKTNGLLPKGVYTFGDDGKMISNP